MVGGAARLAVVDLLSRINKADQKGMAPFYRPDSPPHTFHPWEISLADHDDDDDFQDDDSLVIGLFGTQERAMFMQEILQQVVIGMGRLDVGLERNIDPIDERPTTKSRDTDRINPYFPSFTTTSSSSFYPWSPSASSRSTESTSVHSRNMSSKNSPGTEFPLNSPSTSPSRSLVGLGSTINANR